MNVRAIKYMILAVLACLFICSLASSGLLQANAWVKGFNRLMMLCGDLFPPKLDILPQLLSAVGQTIQIAFTGTLIGFFLSLPLAYLGNNILFSRRVTVVVRWLLGIVRTVPSIVFGVIFVVAFGLGEAAGIMAVACYTVGYLAKLFYEAFEAVDPEIIEAIRSTGAKRLQLFRFAILPETTHMLISQLLFMFEYNIRSSTIMGFVGAGGIGYYMLGYIQMLQYEHLAAALLTTLVVVMIIDQISLNIRRLIHHP